MTTTPSPVYQTTPFHLERRRVARWFNVSFHLSDNEMALIRNQQLAILEAEVLAHRADQRTVVDTVKVPATWWQYFKLAAIESGNPFFDLEHVRYRDVTLTTHYTLWATFPEAQMRYPSDLGQPVWNLDVADKQTRDR